MTATWNELPLLKKDAELKLVHREASGRHRVVRVEVDAGIKDVTKDWIHSLHGDCELPYEIVGVDGKKPAKIRFHPDVLELAETDDVVQEAVKRTVFSMLDQLFLHDWVFPSAIVKQEPLPFVHQIQGILSQQTPVLEITAEYRVNITWKVGVADLLPHGKPTKVSPQKRVKLFDKFFDKAAETLKVSVRSPNLRKAFEKQKPDNFERIANLDVVPPTQVVEVHYAEKSSPRKPVISIELVGFPLLDDSAYSCHRIEYSDKLETIRLDLAPKFSRSKRCNWIVPHQFVVIGYGRFIKNSGKFMIDCAQFRVQELRRDLTDSLSNYPKAMAFTSDKHSIPAAGEASVVKASKTCNNTPIEMMFLSANAVVVNVQSPPSGRRASLSGRFQVSPTPNAPPPTVQQENNNEIKPLHVDALSPSFHKSTNLVVSPSDSIDSGVVSPGAMSDEDRVRMRAARMGAAGDGFHVPKMRDRSASECYHSNIPGLKGILKKPKSPNGFTCTSVCGVLKRSPASSRMLYARSVSECHDGDVLSELDFFGQSNDTLSSCSPPQCDRGFFRVDEEDEHSLQSDSDSPPAELASRKKRVSFSEHVQARIYRSNSSILGQKKKNERKKRSKRHRSDSESTLNGDESPLSMSPAESAVFAQAVRDMNSPDHRDSAVELASPANAGGSPSKRVTRIVSADSAFGEELDTETESRFEMLSMA